MPLRGPSCPFVDIFFLPGPSRISLPTPGGPLPSLLQPLSAPSWSFVPLRGNLFFFLALRESRCRPLADPSPSLLQPLRGPSCPFVDIFFLPGPSRISLPTPGGSLPSLLQPLRGPSCPFVDIFFLPGPSRISLPTPGGSLPSLLQPLRVPSWSFVPLRGHLFSSWPFANLVADPWRIPLEPPPTPSCPFVVLRAPSWTSFSTPVTILLRSLRGLLLSQTLWGAW